jgi:hypothetical protein
MKYLKEDFDQSLLQRGLHLLILFGIAVAYPAFQILTGSATFFIAGEYHSRDLLFLTATLCFFIPLTLLFFEWVLGARRITGRCAHAFVIFLLIAMIVLPGLKKAANWPTIWMVSLSFSIAGILTTLYVRMEAARSALTFLTPLVLIIPGWFLLNDRINRIIWEQPQTIAAASFKAENPVVLVVFDELPLISLLDENGKIDERRFPNFAELASCSTWYANATTVSDKTMSAVPAILTGKYPDDRKLPIRIDHPKNLISLFENRYEVHASESTSRFLRSYKNNQDFTKQSVNLLSDISLVYLHYLLPSKLTRQLPPVDQTWGNFFNLIGIVGRNRMKSQDDRDKKFRRFVFSIKQTEKPGLYFIHTMLPHIPWQYFPSGKQYNGNGMGYLGIDGVKSNIWLNDQHIVDFARQRHLDQVEFTDSLLGMLIDSLKKKKLFRSALIVVVSDHGACFHPDQRRRLITKEHYEDVLHVPLFIKAPYQKKGSIDTSNAQIVDIFPTILDILNIDCDWSFDGRSLIGGSPEPSVRVAFSGGQRFEFPFQKQPLWLTHERFSIGPDSQYPSVIGLNLKQLTDSGTSPIEIHLHDANGFSNVRLRSLFLPALITAHIDPQKYSTKEIFGVVVNGIVRSALEPFLYDDRTAFISTLVPETSFRDGPNDVDIVILQNDGKEFRRPKIIRDKRWANSFE